MTLVQEATEIMKKMPIRNQQVVVDLLKMMNTSVITRNNTNYGNAGFKRTGKANFKLPAGFDEHFDDMNSEIAAMFEGDNK